MVVCMDVSLLFSNATMVVCMDVSLLFSSDKNGCMYGCVIVVFE